MTRPTIHDVAEAAQVSLATVDRVLNRRGGVAAKSVEKVVAAVDATGYVRDRHAANMSRNRDDRLVFVLPLTDNAFGKAVVAALAEQAGRLLSRRVRIETRFVPAFSADDTARALCDLSREEVDGIALMGVGGPVVAAAAQRLSDAGIPLVTLVADPADLARDGYVGPDNLKAGRTAAALLGKMLRGRRGEVVVLSGSSRARDHVDRRHGFGETLARAYPDLAVSLTPDSEDEADRNYAFVTALMRKPDVIGVYSVGAGNRGLFRALADLGDAPRPVTVVHELTPHSRPALEQGLIDLVIDQDPQAEVAAAIAILRDLIAGRPVAPGAGLIQPRLYVAENLP